MTRYRAKTEVVNGTRQSAALTALVDIEVLFYGDFKKYLTRGIYDGAVCGFSSCIEHLFLSNGAVLTVLVGSGFDMFRLVSTGDWQCFGKNLGLNTVGATGACAGASVGGRISLVAGPIGGAEGGLVWGEGEGGVIAGGFGSWKIVAKSTVLEVQRHMRSTQLSPDSSLGQAWSPTRRYPAKRWWSLWSCSRAAVNDGCGYEQLHGALVISKHIPNEFHRFLELLRAANTD